MLQFNLFEIRNPFPRFPEFHSRSIALLNYNFQFKRTSQTFRGIQTFCRLLVWSSQASTEIAIQPPLIAIRWRQCARDLDKFEFRSFPHTKTIFVARVLMENFYSFRWFEEAPEEAPEEFQWEEIRWLNVNWRGWTLIFHLIRCTNYTIAYQGVDKCTLRRGALAKKHSYKFFYKFLLAKKETKKDFGWKFLFNGRLPIY